MNKRHLRKVEAGKGEKQTKKETWQSCPAQPVRSKGTRQKIQNPPSKKQARSKKRQTTTTTKNIAGIKTACRGRAATADKQLNCGDEEWKIKYTKYSLDEQVTEETKETSEVIKLKTLHKTLNKDTIINT